LHSTLESLELFFPFDGFGREKAFVRTAAGRPPEPSTPEQFSPQKAVQGSFVPGFRGGTGNSWKIFNNITDLIHADD
jgi:hypothetical protein